MYSLVFILANYCLLLPMWYLTHKRESVLVFITDYLGEEPEC